MKETIELFTSQRERLDALKNGITLLPNTRGKSLAFTSLEKGRMYIGEICGELGKEYPYADTKKATTAEGIQEAVDKATKSTPAFLDKGNEIVNLNDLRDLMDKEVDTFLVNITKLAAMKPSIKKFVIDCKVSEAYRSLLEARMWLGVRLGEIKDGSK